MGLISEYVEVRLGGKNCKYYEKLGYKIPKITNKYGNTVIAIGSKIKVKVQDLTKGSSSVFVEVECDNCHKHYDIRYVDYLRRDHDGKIYCIKCKSTVLISGENHPLYNPNRTEDERYRESSEYKDFVKRVLKRDNYTCQCCGKKSSGNLEVHHLNGYAWFKEGRSDDTNGITLCKTCHSNFHAHYGNRNNTKEQYEEWIGYNIELLKYEGKILPTRKVYCIDNDTVYDSAEIAAKELGIYDKSQIHKTCNQKYQHVACGYHFLWYDVYLTMSEDEIKAYVYQCDNPYKYRKVICLETKEIFDKPADACKKYGNKNQTSLIINACKEVRTALIDFDGNPLHWMYYDTYLKKVENNEEVTFHKNRNVKKVICITTNKIFETVKDAGLYYNIKPTTISACCNKKNKSAGKLSDGVSLYWMYYDEYLDKKNKNEQIIIPKKEYKKNKVICITTNKVFASIKEASLFYNIEDSLIVKCCKNKLNFVGTLSDDTPLEWMYYEDYLRKINNGETIKLLSYNPRKRKVVCSTVGQIFNSLTEAAKHYNLVNSSCIMNACKGKTKYSGKLPDGTPLKWMYYDDFLKLPIEEQNEILSRNNESSTDGSFLLDKEAM